MYNRTQRIWQIVLFHITLKKLNIFFQRFVEFDVLMKHNWLLLTIKTKYWSWLDGLFMFLALQIFLNKSLSNVSKFFLILTANNQIHFTRFQRIFCKFLNHFTGSSASNSMINDPHHPHIIIKMHFRRLEFKLILLNFRSFNFLDNFLFEIKESFTVAANKALIFARGHEPNTFLMIPLKAALAQDHRSTPFIEAIAIDRRLMLLAEYISKASPPQILFLSFLGFLLLRVLVVDLLFQRFFQLRIRTQPLETLCINFVDLGINPLSGEQPFC